MFGEIGFMRHEGYRAAIRREIDEELELEAEFGGSLQPWLRQAIRYHLGLVAADFSPLPGTYSGKMLRPMMTLLSYQCLSEHGEVADLTPVLPIAAAIELLHQHSLVHDDIEDGDRQRWNRPTVWALWGQPLAINLGNCVHVLAFRRLARAGERGLAAVRVARILRFVADQMMLLADGQHDDIFFEHAWDVTVEMYMKMIGGKCSALLGCATGAGAMAISDDEARIGAIIEFGRQLGMAYQIKDDMLDIWGCPEQTGRPLGRDIRRRKKTLPVLFALNECRAETRQRLLEIHRSTAPMAVSDERFIVETLTHSGARAFCQMHVDRCSRRARELLQEIGGEAAPGARGVPLEVLHRLTDALTERVK